MTYLPLAADPNSCGPVSFAAHSVLDVVQFVGELLIPAAAVWIVAEISR